MTPTPTPPRLSPSKGSPHGPALRPYADYPHLLGSDPRRGTLFGGYGEVRVWRIVFVLAEDAAPFGEGFAVDDGSVLCVVVAAEAARVAPMRLLPDTMRSQTNLVFAVTFGGELGEAFAERLAALGLWRVERCTVADIIEAAATPPPAQPEAPPPPSPPDLPPPEEPPAPPPATAAEADAAPALTPPGWSLRWPGPMNPPAHALLFGEASSTRVPELVIVADEAEWGAWEHAEQPALCLPSNTWTPALADALYRLACICELAGGWSHTFDVLVISTDVAVFEVIRADLQGLTVRHSAPPEDAALWNRGAWVRPVATEAELPPVVGFDPPPLPPFPATTPRTDQPVLEVSFGFGFKKTINGEGKTREAPIGYDCVKEVWKGTPEQLYGELKKGHKPEKKEDQAQWSKQGRWIAGGTFNTSDHYPFGHRCRDHLKRLDLCILDIDNLPGMTRRAFNSRLRGLRAGCIFYSTWSHARAVEDGGKEHFSARVIFWFSRPLTSEGGKDIGKQLAFIVQHLAKRLGISISRDALDDVSRRPEQLMWTPRCRPPGAPWSEHWCDFFDGPPLDSDAILNGVPLADLLADQPSVKTKATAPTAPLLAALSAAEAPAVSPIQRATPAPPVAEDAATPAPPTPPAPPPRGDTSHRSHRSRALDYIQKCVKTLSEILEEDSYKTIKSVANNCAGVAKWNDLTLEEGLEPLEAAVNAWDTDNNKEAQDRQAEVLRHLRNMFTNTYHKGKINRRFPDNLPPSSSAPLEAATGNSSAPPPQPSPPAGGGQSPPSYPPSQDLNPTPPNDEGTAPPAPEAPRPPRFLKGNPAKFDRWITDTVFVFEAFDATPQNERPGVALVASVPALHEAARYIPPRSAVRLYMDPHSPLTAEAISLLTSLKCAFNNIYPNETSP